MGRSSRSAIPARPVTENLGRNKVTLTLAEVEEPNNQIRLASWTFALVQRVEREAAPKNSSAPLS